MPGNRGMTYLKKDCNQCRALQRGKCVLGFSMDLCVEPFLPSSGNTTYVPQEPCPKPRTYKRLDELKSEATYPEG